MNKPLVWSHRAIKDLRTIKSSFDQRNRSALYSTKLMKGIKASSKFIEKYPLLSLPTNDENVRGFVIVNYIIFYQIFEKNILALAIWDCRKNEQQLKNILKINQ